jgi:hypothetical protein
MRQPAKVRFPTPAHQALADRALEALGLDGRVVAVFVGGSLATGQVDEESDLDLTVIVDDSGLDSFWEGLGRWFHSVGRPVAVAPGPMPHLLTGLMHDGLRLDVAVVARTALASRPRRPMVALHDPDDVLVGLEFASPRFEPTPEWLSSHVSDFLRFLDQLNVVVVRGEWIAGVDNTWYLISRLLDLYAHSNRAPRTSPRRVNARLTPAQQMAVESLPPIQANEASVVGVHLAVARLYRTEARALADKLGAEWPTELEEAVLDHLRVRTGTDFAS